MHETNGPRNMSRVMIGLISVQTAILLGGIPWAYVVQGRLTRVETALNAMIPAARLVSAHDHEALASRVVRLEVIEELRNRPSLQPRHQEPHQ